MANENDQTKYVGAPYNFVPFADPVLPYPNSGEMPKHDDVSWENETGQKERLYSGEFSYEIKAETQIFVGEGKEPDASAESFYRNSEGKYAIPGSSLRGMIRSNAQILSLSSVGDDVDNYRLMYRQIAGKDEKLKKTYGDILGAETISMGEGSISILKYVRAGYIKNIDGKYWIYDTMIDSIDSALGDMNYYVLSERTIAENIKADKHDFDFLANKELQHYVKEGFYEDVRDEWNPKTRKTEKRPHYLGYKEGGGVKENEKGVKQDVLNISYEPFEIECSYQSSGRSIIAVGPPDGDPEEYPEKGYAVSTGKMQEKKAIYIIPAANYDKKKYKGKRCEYSFPIEVPEEDEKAFKIDLSRRETTLIRIDGDKIVSIKEHFSLPENGESRPVFYIRHGGRLYFGFTPRLRLFYDHMIHDGVPKSHLRGGMDYVKAIFGYSNNNESFKSRVSFTDAVLKEGTGHEERVVDLILAEPKPSSYMDYLKPNKKGEAVNYNEDRLKLRGIKQTWLHAEEKPIIAADKREKKYTTHFEPLSKGSCFIGKVRFHNLKLEELGLLLWATRLEKSSHMNIGKAKAYGFGHISIDLGKVKCLDPEKAYDLTSLRLDPFDEVDADNTIQVYKEYFKKRLGKDPEEYESIRVLLLMKDSENLPDPEEIRYMSLDNKEYQSRVTPLPTAKQVLGLDKRTGKPFAGTPQNKRSKSEQNTGTVIHDSEKEAQRAQEVRKQKAEQLEQGKAYEAKIIEVKGKKVKCQLIEHEKIYSVFSVDQIAISGVSVDRKAVSKVFPKDSIVKVCFAGMQKTEEGNEKFVWECVELPKKE